MAAKRYGNVLDIDGTGAYLTPIYGTIALDADGTVPVPNSFKRINTAASTLVKTGAGTLKSVTVNAKGTVASTVTVYDGTSAAGTVIAVIDSLNNVGSFAFDVGFATGLFIVTTGTVAPDITVSYR